MFITVGSGWSIATGAWPSKISGDRSAGNVGFTTELFWDYYCFTQNKTALNEIVYPVLANAARYITQAKQALAEQQKAAAAEESAEG